MVFVENTQQPKARYLTVTYDPLGQGTAVHAAVIPLTSDYSAALTSAREALQKYFPSGSLNKPRWLAIQVTTTAGDSWAEISPRVFPEIIEQVGVEFRLCEGPQNVSALPLGTLNGEDTLYNFKVITIGESGVGKSMMLQHFTKPEDQRSDVPSVTVGVNLDISTRFMTTQGARLKVILWDTAGQEVYRSMIEPYYRHANSVFLVYSVTNRPSFVACKHWLEDLRAKVDDYVPVMLIGNQIDKNLSRTVKTSEGEEFALNNNLLFAEISAKSGTGVEYAFQTLVDEVFSRLKGQNKLSEYDASRRTRKVDLNAQESNSRPSRSGCASSTYAGLLYVFGYRKV